jgi:hypothetical protein
VKRGDNFSLLFQNFPLSYDTKGVQGNQEVLKLIGTHQLLVYAEDVNMVEKKLKIP